MFRNRIFPKSENNFVKVKKMFCVSKIGKTGIVLEQLTLELTKFKTMDSVQVQPTKSLLFFEEKPILELDKPTEFMTLWEVPIDLKEFILQSEEFLLVSFYKINNSFCVDLSHKKFHEIKSIHTVLNRLNRYI